MAVSLHDILRETARAFVQAYKKDKDHWKNEITSIEVIKHAREVLTRSIHTVTYTKRSIMVLRTIFKLSMKEDGTEVTDCCVCPGSGLEIRTSVEQHDLKKYLVTSKADHQAYEAMGLRTCIKARDTVISIRDKATMSNDYASKLQAIESELREEGVTKDKYSVLPNLMTLFLLPSSAYKDALKTQSNDTEVLAERISTSHNENLINLGSTFGHLELSPKGSSDPTWKTLITMSPHWHDVVEKDGNEKEISRRKVYIDKYVDSSTQTLLTSKPLIGEYTKELRQKAKDDAIAKAKQELAAEETFVRDQIAELQRRRLRAQKKAKDDIKDAEDRYMG